MSKLIVGLGNWPKEYEGTKHNVGFEFIDEITKKLNLDSWRDFTNGKYIVCEINNEKVFFAKPHTLMNLSGDFIQPFMNFYKIRIDDLIVVCDDLDTPIGSLKFKLQGSSGGQNGLKSIINRLSTEQFKRLKIGIGRPENKNFSIPNYVLSKFDFNQKNLVNSAINHAVEAVLIYLNDNNLNKLLNKINSKKYNLEH